MLSKFLPQLVNSIKSKPLLKIGTRSLSGLVENDKYVIVQEQSAHAERMKFPNVWLRDNCSCSKCFHETSQSRSLDWGKFDLGIKVKSLKVCFSKFENNILNS